MRTTVRERAAPVTRLSLEPLVHPTARVHDCTLGRYTEIDERCRLTGSSLGDYSYVMQDGEIWTTRIGRFANVASHVRLNATNHPIERASQHHFTYRSSDWPGGTGRTSASPRPCRISGRWT